MVKTLTTANKHTKKEYTRRKQTDIFQMPNFACSFRKKNRLDFFFRGGAPNYSCDLNQLVLIRLYVGNEMFAFQRDCSN